MRLKASFGALGVLILLSLSEVGIQPQLHADPGSEGASGPICLSSIELVEKIRHYDFFGTRASDADRSLRRRLLVSQDFAGRIKRFTGQTDWHIEWRTCLEPHGTGCRVSGVVATVNVTYTLPRWADRQFAPAAVGSRWHSYATNLLAHEKGHGRIAMDVAAMMQRAVIGIADTDSCQSVNAQANRIVAEIMQRGEAMQNQYDRVTDHGSRQGAVFPF